MAPGTVTKVLIANRGEIACRAQRACKKLGLGCVAVFTEPDALSLHVLQAAESVCLGASPKEYLNAAKLIKVAKSTGEAPWQAGLGRHHGTAASHRCLAVMRQQSLAGLRPASGISLPPSQTPKQKLASQLPFLCPSCLCQAATQSFRAMASSQRTPSLPPRARRTASPSSGPPQVRRAAAAASASRYGRAD